MPEVQILSVSFDSELGFKSPLPKVIKKDFFHLRNIARDREPDLSMEGAKKLSHVFLFSCLDVVLY